MSYIVSTGIGSAIEDTITLHYATDMVTHMYNTVYV